MTAITGEAIPAFRHYTLLKGLELEIKSGMNIGRRSASAIIKGEMDWAKNLSKAVTLHRYKQWMCDNVWPTFGDIVFEYTDGLNPEPEWRYLRRGESRYFEWNDAFTADAGMTAQQMYDTLVKQGLNEYIIEDMVAQSMGKWRNAG